MEAQDLDTDHRLRAQAVLWYQQGKYAEAEPVLKRALVVYERQLGPAHPDTANCLNNLAMLYHAQGRYVQAEALYQRALRIYERQLGPDHPDTASSLSNLAALLSCSRGICAGRTVVPACPAYL